MSYTVEAALTKLFETDAALIALLGKDADGSPSVYPYHARTVQDVNFPAITISRTGSLQKDSMFQDSDIGLSMENMRLAICVWSTNTVDECHAIYERIRVLLETPYASFGNLYFTPYRMTRHLMRDDLFDNQINAYHLHAEYSLWIRKNSGTTQPIPA